MKKNPGGATKQRRASHDAGERQQRLQTESLQLAAVHHVAVKADLFGLTFINKHPQQQNLWLCLISFVLQMDDSPAAF